MSRKVTVLMGGFSAERPVSLNSGAAAIKALGEAGYQAEGYDLSRDLAAFMAHIDQSKPDVVFNALHGRYGEDGAIQGLLDIMGIPYTHSGRLASAMAMDKPTAKRLFADAGIPVAAHKLVTVGDIRQEDPLPRPYVVKPADEGSSVGVYILREEDNQQALQDCDWPDDMLVMAEAFIPGRELTVAVMGGLDGSLMPLGVTEITTHRGFYDYDAKYADGGSRHVLPAEVPAEIAVEASRLAVRAHSTLGCRGVSRSDFRWDGKTMYALEINTQPGMTATSLVPEQAAFAGISFPELVTWMVENAKCDA